MPPAPGIRPRRTVVFASVGLAVSIWLLRLRELRKDVECYRRYWSVPRGDPRGIVYVALGDSTAQGLGASAPERGYVGLLARRLRRATGCGVTIHNLSRVGARVHDVVADQLPKLAGLTPDLVTVAVGGNDVRHYDATRFHADVDALIAGLPANAVVGDVPWFMHGAIGRKADEAAEYVAGVALARGLPVVELHRAMRDRGWTSMVTDFAADWFHPNDRGYRVWADAFWEPTARHSGLAGPGAQS